MIHRTKVTTSYGVQPKHLVRQADMSNMSPLSTRDMFYTLIRHNTRITFQHYSTLPPTITLFYPLALCIHRITTKHYIHGLCIHLEILLESTLIELHESLMLGRLVRSVPIEEFSAHSLQGRPQCRRDHVIHRQSDQLITKRRGGKANMSLVWLISQ